MNLLFFAAWADYEEDGWIVICEEDGKYFYQEGGHCVMVGYGGTAGWKPFEFCPQPISEEEALDLMEEWAEHEEPETSLDEVLRLLK